MTGRIVKTIVGGEESRTAVEFFEGPCSDFITDEKTRKGLLIFAFCVAIPFFIAAFYLSPTCHERSWPR